MEKDVFLKALLDNQELRTGFLKAMLEKEASKDADGTWDYQRLHGSGGLWSLQALEQDVVTARVTPAGLGAALTRVDTINESPLYGILTGYTQETGARATSICADAPQGFVKGCTLTAQFGLTRHDSNEVEVTEAMLKIGRGDFTDLRLVGQVLGMTGFQMSDLTQDQILTLVIMNEMVKTAQYAENELATDLWTGTTAVGAFPGLDYQVATGQVDAVSGTTCPAVDSDVKDFGYTMVDGTAKDIVSYVQTMEAYLRFNAKRMHLEPVEWVLVMRPELWYELSAVWPCRYDTNRCANSAGTNVAVINDDSNTRKRDAMRQGMYLDVNGRRLRVIEDDGIYEHTNINDAHLNPGQYASSIYFIPLTITGGMPVTYMEYIDFNAAVASVSQLGGRLSFWASSNGFYSWSVTEKKGWCYQLHLAAKTRVVLRTPHLAGKIQHVAYEPLQHFRSPFPGNPYNADGGVSIRPITTRQHVWS